MKKKVLLSSLLMLATLGSSALAKKISITGHSQDKVQKMCGNTGVFWPEGGTTATYGCMNKDGSGIVCGGVTPKDKKTCDTFRTVPPRLVQHFRELTAAQNKAGTQ